MSPILVTSKPRIPILRLRNYWHFYLAKEIVISPAIPKRSTLRIPVHCKMTIYRWLSTLKVCPFSKLSGTLIRMLLLLWLYRVTTSVNIFWVNLYELSGGGPKSRQGVWWKCRNCSNTTSVHSVRDLCLWKPIRKFQKFSYDQIFKSVKWGRYHHFDYRDRLHNAISRDRLTFST